MKNKALPITMLLGVAMLLAACASQVAPAAKNAGTSTAIVQGDPTEGQAGLMKSLEAAGAQVELGDTVQQPFLGPTGQILKVNGQDVQVFEYPSAEAMEAEAAQVAPDGGSVGTSMMSWMATPHFFKSGNVLVVYVGDDTAVLQLLTGSLGEQFAGR